MKAILLIAERIKENPATDRGSFDTIDLDDTQEMEMPQEIVEVTNGILRIEDGAFEVVISRTPS